MTMPSDVGDITTFYLENFMPKTWQDIARPRQFYAVTELLNKRRKMEPASEKTTWNLKVNSAANTTADSFFSEDSLNRIDLGIKAELKWSYQKTHMLWDRREPALRSSSETKILDYMDMQKTDMYDGFYEQNENWFWTLPTAPNDGSAGDPVPFGVPYYVTQSSTTAFGFNGDVPTNYTTVAGVSPTTYPKWKNGTFRYTSMNNGDFSKKLGEAMDKCQFGSPRPGSDNEEEPALDFELVSSYKPWQDYQDFLFESNDTTGMDAGKYRGGRPSYSMNYQMFRGVPWSWSPAISEVSGTARDLNEPVYGLNWSTWDVCSQNGLFMEQDEPIKLNNSHNTRVVWMDTALQYRCNNRRLNFVGRAVNASAT
jgi:hypothetical protein